jgi:hypothetical protein
LELAPRGCRLRAALAAVLVRDNAPELRLVRAWLDSWSGIGLIVVGVLHRRWDIQLTATPRATGGRTSSRSGSRTPSPTNLTVAAASWRPASSADMLPQGHARATRQSGAYL